MFLQSGQSPFDLQDSENQQIIIEPDPVHRNVRAVSRCGLIVSGVLSFSILARLLPAIAPFYGVAIGVGIAVLLATLVFSKGYETRLFALIIAALAIGGMLLGWWDWLWFVFSDSSGASLFFQLLIISGVVVLVAALFQVLRKGENHEDS